MINRPLMPLTDYMKDSIKRVVTAVNYSGNREPHATLFGDVHGYNSLATLAYTGDESPLRDVFSRMYSTMSRANWIIQELVKKERERR